MYNGNVTEKWDIILLTQLSIKKDIIVSYFGITLYQDYMCTIIGK